MIVMTRPLMNFYARYVSRKCKMLEMPMTVDSSRFHVDKTPSPYGKHIAYCGNMDDKKDGVTNLIQAFGLFHPSHPKVKLLIIGDTTRLDGFEEIKKESDGIVFYGRANREDIPQLLMNASALALARPRNLQSLGGGPHQSGRVSLYRKSCCRHSRGRPSPLSQRRELVLGRTGLWDKKEKN